MVFGSSPELRGHKPSNPHCIGQSKGAAVTSHPSNRAFPFSLTVGLALAVLAIVFGGVFFYRFQERQQLRLVESELTAIARLKVNQISDWRSDQVADGKAFESDVFLKQSIAQFFASSKDANRRDLLQRLGIIAQQHGYDDILVVDPAGAIRTHLKQPEEPCTEFLPILQGVLQSGAPVLSEFHAGSHNPAPHVSCVAPLSNGKGAPLGALVLVCNAKSYLYPLIESRPVSSRSAETLLVRRDGEDALFLNELRHRPNTALNLRVPLRGVQLPGVQAVQGQHGFVLGRDYRNIEVAAVLMPIPGSSWHLVAKVDAEEAFAIWRFRSAMILLLMGTLVAAVLAAGFAFWQLDKKRQYRKLLESETMRREDAERYRITLQSIGDAVLSTDAMGRVTMLNPVAEALTGWCNADACGRPLEEIFHIVNEETRNVVESPVVRVLREGSVVGLANHTLLIAKNGIERPIADSGAPLHNESNEILGAVLVFRDQTVEREILKALQESKVRLRSILDCMMEGCQIIDRHGCYEYLNDLAEMHTRRKREELLGKKFADVWPGAESSELYIRVLRCLEESLVSRLEYEQILPDGSVRWFDFIIQPVPDGVMVLSQEISERKRAEMRQRQLFDIIENSLNEIYIFDARTFRFLHANRGALTNLQYSYAEIRELTALDLKPEISEARFREMVRPLLDNTQESVVFETVHKRADGSLYPVEVHLQLIDSEKERVFLAIIFDIAERKRAEKEREKLQAQLIQAQKMESVGRLAGGIAHDFNNLLTIILGYGEMLRKGASDGPPDGEALQEIHGAALRARDLTRQLLAFSRKQVLEFRTVDINAIVTGFERLLRRLLGEDVDLRLALCEESLPVSADASQLEQVLMNLAVNARDAMADGGSLTIETRKTRLEESPDSGKGGLGSGEYALMEIRDTGCGMDAATLEQLFEPFFTTKEKDKGTGLGLATSYGIIRQHGGNILVYSEPGLGSTFEIYLPLHADTALAQSPAVKRGEIDCHSMTILVVEDDGSLNRLAVRILEGRGYHVICAASGEEAVREAANHVRPIHLVLTDVIMPGIKGPEAFAQIALRHPEARVLYMSGYTDDMIGRQGVLKAGVHFIQKPFAVRDLLDRVEQVLRTDTSPESGASDRDRSDMV